MGVINLSHLDTTNKLKLYLKDFINKSAITYNDIAEIELNFFLDGETVHNTISYIDDYGELNEIQQLMNKLIVKIGIRKSLFLKGTIQKLYLKICELQHANEKALHKGLILYMEGLIYYYLENNQLGIKFITLALIEDVIHRNINWARRSSAFRFLATNIYDEETADRIIQEINKRLIEEVVSENTYWVDQSYAFRIFANQVNDEEIPVIIEEINKQLKELKKPLYPEDVLNIDEHMDIIPGEINNLFNLNLILFKNLFQNLTSVDDEDKDKKGKMLEIISKNLFSSLIGLQLLKDRFKTKSSELDLVYRILDHDNPFHEMFGQYLIIECKNWKDPVGAPVIRSFVGNLQSVNVTGGILIAKKGISGQNHKKKLHAELEIAKAYHRHGITIIVLTENDLKEIADGANLIKILLKNYEMTRFDKP